MASTEDPQVVTLQTIEAALKLIDIKKEALRKAYDDLQAHSSLLSSSFSLSWSELDSHFTSHQNNLTHRFRLLQAMESCQNNGDPTHPSLAQVESAVTHDLSRPLLAVGGDSTSNSDPTSHCRVDSDVTRGELVVAPDQPRQGSGQDPSSSNPPDEDPSLSSMPMSQACTGSVQPRSDLIVLCENMDSKRLRSYINEHSKERNDIRAELLGAMQFAEDQGAMVLDAMEGFYPSKSNKKANKNAELTCLRKTCLDLLDALAKNAPTLSNEVKNRARKLALEWQANMNAESALETLGFLQFLLAYKLEKEFDADELVEYFVTASPKQHTVAMFRALGLEHKTDYLIHKLVDGGERLIAVKCIFEFGLVDKFPPVPLLKHHLKELKQSTKRVCGDGMSSIKSRKEARSREVKALRTVLKIIDDHKLQSKCPKVDLKNRIGFLEKQKDNRNQQKDNRNGNRNQQKDNRNDNRNQQKDNGKRGAPSSSNKPQQPAKKVHQNGNKRRRTTAMVGPSAVPIGITSSTSTIPPFQQSNLQLAGYSPASRLYGLASSTPPVAFYAGLSAGRYVLAGNAMGFPGNPSAGSAVEGFHGNPNSSGAYLSYSELQMPPGYYDRSTAYGGYGLPPQYHPTHYP